MSADRISLSVPPRGEYALAVRMTAVALVSHLDAPIDVIEDIRIAVEEAYIFACNHAGGADVTLTFDLSDDTLVVRTALQVDTSVVETDAADQYSRFILESICDEFELDAGDGGALLRLVKRLF